MRSPKACVLGVHKPFISLGIAAPVLHKAPSACTFVCKKNWFIPAPLHKFSTQFSTCKNGIFYLLASGFYTVYTPPIIRTSWGKKSIHYLVGFSLEGGSV